MVKVLIVDDEKDIVDYLSETLQDNFSDIEVEKTYSGEEALAKAKEIHYDLIITDYAMPVMDGGQFIAHVKAENSINRDCPVFLISGHITGTDDGPEILEKVMFFEKPLDLPRFIRFAKFVVLHTRKKQADH